jgi:hypothetical protein
LGYFLNGNRENAPVKYGYSHNVSVEEIIYKGSNLLMVICNEHHVAVKILDNPDYGFRIINQPENGEIGSNV